MTALGTLSEDELFRAHGAGPPPDPTHVLTRLEVIDHRANGEGRVFVAWGCRVSLSYQDNGRTLKVFVSRPRA